jgi:hypothetical protein
MAKSNVPATTSDAIESVKLDARRAWLKELWIKTKFVDVFTSFGVDSIDAEVKATWGDWNTRRTPFDVPFNGGPVPIDYQDADPSPLKQALSDSINGRTATATSKTCPSAWGIDVNKKARAFPGFSHTKQAKFSDCDLARAIWKDWQLLPKREPAKLQRIVGQWIAATLNERG